MAVGEHVVDTGSAGIFSRLDWKVGRYLCSVAVNAMVVSSAVS